jgi:hypothetical protein
MVFYYRKLVKMTSKTDRLLWLKSIDDNVKTKPKEFWKYVFEFKKNDHITELRIDEKIITALSVLLKPLRIIFLRFVILSLLLLFQQCLF